MYWNILAYKKEAEEDQQLSPGGDGGSETIFSGDCTPFACNDKYNNLCNIHRSFSEYSFEKQDLQEIDFLIPAENKKEILSYSVFRKKVN